MHTLDVENGAMRIICRTTQVEYQGFAQRTASYVLRNRTVVSVHPKKAFLSMLMNL